MGEDKIKIGMVVENIPSGVISGGRYHAMFIACGLVEIGHNVTVITNHQPRFLPMFDQYKLPKFRYANLRRLNKDIGRFDLVITSPILATEWGLRFARSIDTTCWSFVLDCETLCKKHAPAVASRMHYGPSHTKALRGSDLLLSISDFAVSHIMKWTKNRNAISLMGCVNSRLADTILGRQGDRFIAITRLTEHKRINDLIYLAREIGANIDIITSHSPSEVARRVNSVSDRIWVHGFLGDADKFEMIKSARALICPSAYEGLGIPAMEAMYCGVPVICYDFPILKEVCGNGALYASYCSPESLANQVKKIMGDDNLRQDLAARAFRKGKDYSFEALCGRLEGVIEKWAA